MDPEFLKKFNEMFSKVSQMETKLDVMLAITDKVDKIEKYGVETRTEVELLKQENEDLFCRMNEIEQYSRKRNVIINDIPFKEGENIKEEVQRFTSEIKIELKDYEINAIHRLPSKKEHPPILVCLNSLEKKNELIEWSKQNSKKQGTNKKPIFISEHLTKYNGELLREAKQREDIKYAWVKNGRILIRRNEESGIEELRSRQQLEEVNTFEEETENENVASEDEIESNETTNKKEKANSKKKQSSLDQFMASSSKAGKSQQQKKQTTASRSLRSKYIKPGKK